MEVYINLRFFQTAFLIASTLLAFTQAQAQKGIDIHSLGGPYGAGNAYLPYWDTTGNCEMNDFFMRLTADEPGKRGAIWNNQPSEVRDWEFQMKFQIHGKGMNLNGDGMAIWYAREPLHLGPVFGSKNYFAGAGIFIDTFKNHEEDENNFPYISVMVNNGTLNYNGEQDGIYTRIGGCNAKVRNSEHPVKIAVSYIRASLMVFLDTEGFGIWQQCFKSQGIHLPTGYYFGVSASTGELSDNHDVYSITLLDLQVPGMETEDRSRIMPEAEYFVLPKEYKDEKVEDKEDNEEEKRFTPISILKKFLYASGIATILAVAVSLIKKYLEKRRVKMEKRLY